MYFTCPSNALFLEENCRLADGCNTIASVTFRKPNFVLIAESFVSPANFLLTVSVSQCVCPDPMAVPPPNNHCN